LAGAINTYSRFATPGSILDRCVVAESFDGIAGIFGARVEILAFGVVLALPPADAAHADPVEGCAVVDALRPILDRRVVTHAVLRIADIHGT
jgi:hypothetical protein